MPHEDDGAASEKVVLGRLGAPNGLRGWIRVHAFTDPPGAIFDYPSWTLSGRTLAGSGTRRAIQVEQSRQHGKGYVARLAGVTDRDAAGALTGLEISVARSEMPELSSGYYWADLLGMEVFTSDAQSLGKVQRLMETGANDVLVVNGDRERLIPWIVNDVIISVDARARRIEVDWDADF